MKHRWWTSRARSGRPCSPTKSSPRFPTVGSYNALLVLVPAIFGGQQDVSTGPCNSCTFSSHGTLLDGGRANREARLLVDGISIAVPQAGGTNT